MSRKISALRGLQDCIPSNGTALEVYCWGGQGLHSAVMPFNDDVSLPSKFNRNGKKKNGMDLLIRKISNESQDSAENLYLSYAYQIFSNYVKHNQLCIQKGYLEKRQDGNVHP